VKAFLDSSVLVATFYGDHLHHPPSAALYARQNRSTGCTAAHCLAEVYSVATGMPGKNRASPGELLPFLHDVRDRLQIVTLDDREYWQAVENAAANGLSGGVIYDALIGACALKASARTIYTWNIRHFQLLGPDIAPRAKEPQ
jgi:predicted nucleic acid-binding protein